MFNMVGISITVAKQVSEDIVKTSLFEIYYLNQYKTPEKNNKKKYI